mmetsp:Transcript_93770/g.205225  ORF Transcript_93770/g.205225 Transcript_93770/m.205225 type:complete len:231 (+) Transcript_93770:468-1160(+)
MHMIVHWHQSRAKSHTLVPRMSRSGSWRRRATSKPSPADTSQKLSPWAHGTSRTLDSGGLVRIFEEHCSKLTVASSVVAQGAVPQTSAERCPARLAVLGPCCRRVPPLAAPPPRSGVATSATGSAVSTPSASLQSKKSSHECSWSFDRLGERPAPRSQEPPQRSLQHWLLVHGRGSDQTTGLPQHPSWYFTTVPELQVLAELWIASLWLLECGFWVGLFPGSYQHHPHPL